MFCYLDLFIIIFICFCSSEILAGTLCGLVFLILIVVIFALCIRRRLGKSSRIV